MIVKKQESSEQQDEITLLFDDARRTLDRIDAGAKKKKKQVVVELAKDLEGKIPIDTISIEIVSQLRGRVSERFIHESLHDKYKQKRRVENAKKRKKRKQREDNENLAAVALLNQDDEDKNKQVIMHDVQGRSIEEEERGKKATNNTAFTDNNNTFVSEAASQQLGEQYKDLECSSCNALYFENLELKKALSRQTILVNADEMSKYELEFIIPKEKYPNLKEAMEKSRDSIYIIFDKTGIVEHAVPDIFRAKQNPA